MVVNGYNGAMPTSPAALQLSIPDRVKGCCQPVAAPIADAGKTLSYSNYQTVQTRLRELADAI
jgi:hypothetical protein